MTKKMGRPPKPAEDKQPLPPKLQCYWESEAFKYQTELFILQQQVAGQLPTKNQRGQRYNLSNFVMDALHEKIDRMEKSRK